MFHCHFIQSISCVKYVHRNCIVVSIFFVWFCLFFFSYWHFLSKYKIFSLFYVHFFFLLITYSSTKSVFSFLPLSTTVCTFFYSSTRQLSVCRKRIEWIAHRFVDVDEFRRLSKRRLSTFDVLFSSFVDQHQPVNPTPRTPSSSQSGRKTESRLFPVAAHLDNPGGSIWSWDLRQDNLPSKISSRTRLG